MVKYMFGTLFLRALTFTKRHKRQGCTIWGALGAPLPGNLQENQALAGNIGAWRRSTGNDHIRKYFSLSGLRG